MTQTHRLASENACRVQPQHKASTAESDIFALPKIFLFFGFGFVGNILKRKHLWQTTSQHAASWRTIVELTLKRQQLVVGSADIKAHHTTTELVVPGHESLQLLPLKRTEINMPTIGCH